MRVDAQERAALADHLGLSEEAFASRYLQADGARLKEGLGNRCVFLQDGEHAACSVYEARPEHCRTFPYWRGVLEDPEAFERARAVCPGIRVEPSPEARAAAFAELEALYEEVDEWVAGGRPVCLARGVCCRFEEAGHELWATALEADYCAARHPEPPRPEAPGRCAFHVEGRCTAREGRPLGCRTYFCDDRTTEPLQELHERMLGRIRELERRHGYAPTYAPFPVLLDERGVGRSEEEPA